MGTWIDMTGMQWIRKAARREEGLAYLEFALILPLLLLLFLGGTELSRYLQAGQKVDKMTHTIVDLIAQAPTISASELEQIMQAAQHIMAPYPFTDDGVIIVSCVGYNQYGQLRVKWQYTGGGELLRNSAIGTAGNTPQLPAGFAIEERDNVIIAESYYAMEPIINSDHVEPIEFYSTAFYLPRLGELDTLQP